MTREGGTIAQSSTPDRREALRRLLPASLLLCGMMASRPAPAGTTSRAPASGGPSSDQARLWLKLVSDLTGRPTFAVTRGDVWGFKPQADDLIPETFARRLYGYWTLVARQALQRPDGSVSLTTKAWTFYLDPAGGAVTTRLPNPYTDQTVECPALSGPARTQMFFAPGVEQAELGLRERRLGEHIWLDLTRVSRFKPSDATWFKLEADMTTYLCRAADADDRTLPFIPSTWSHTLTAEWQTWMHMHGTPGHILFRGEGALIPSLDAAPEALRAAVESRFPGEMAKVKLWERPS